VGSTKVLSPVITIISQVLAIYISLGGQHQVTQSFHEGIHTLSLLTGNRGRYGEGATPGGVTPEGGACPPGF